MAVLPGGREWREGLLLKQAGFPSFMQTLPDVTLALCTIHQFRKIATPFDPMIQF